MFGSLLSSVAAPLLSQVAGKGINKLMGGDVEPSQNVKNAEGQGTGSTALPLFTQVKEGIKQQDMALQQNLQQTSIPTPKKEDSWLKQQGKGIGENLISSMGNIGIQKLRDLIDKPKSASELGQDHADYMKKAYPGTNPWEQMQGAGQGAGGTQGPTSAALINQQTAREHMQSARDVGRIQPESKTIKDKAQVSHIIAEANKVLVDTQISHQEKRRIKNMVEKIAKEIQILEVEKNIKDVELEYYEALVWSKILGTGGVLVGGGAILKGFLTKNPKAMDAIRYITETITKKGGKTIRSKTRHTKYPIDPKKLKPRPQPK